jgi:hypothetical protein
MSNQKSRYYAILAIVLLAASAISVSIGTVNAADVQATYAFIAASPNPAA